uniref:Uncharacterized protein n=1 Tax=Picea glauca TaxID=3330 RepID=A0A117NH65_PICGL|nr:hypothetical protein ABT39_MTgene4895 [Picea glauca]QHR92340.1 hypothetical protein Q903MT_gene6382 [Picea sitchensis]
MPLLLHPAVAYLYPSRTLLLLVMGMDLKLAHEGQDLALDLLIIYVITYIIIIITYIIKHNYISRDRFRELLPWRWNSCWLVRTPYLQR